MSDKLKLIVSIALCEGAGIFGSLFTAKAVPTWYAGLAKPAFNPPDWLFAPVWIVLYAMMGVSLYLIWRKGLKDKAIESVFTFFLVHLLLNAIWSVIFFGMKDPGLALAEISVLWLMIAVLVYKTYSIDRRASLLLIPYFFWVSFASVLNYSIWKLNLPR